MTPLPKYETIIRELTYAIRDLASASEVATYRTQGGGPVPGRVYTVHDEAQAMASAQGRLAGALQAAGEHVDRLERDALIVDAAKAAEVDRLTKMKKKRGAR